MGFWLNCHLIMKIANLKFIDFSLMTLYITTYLDSLSPCPPSYDVLALLDLAFNVNADLQKYFQKMTTRSYSCWLLLFLFLSRIKMIAKLFWLKILCWEHKSIVFICFKCSRLLWPGEFQRMFTHTLAEFCYFNLSRGLKMIVKLFCLKN